MAISPRAVANAAAGASNVSSAAKSAAGVSSTPVTISYTAPSISPKPEIVLGGSSYSHSDIPNVSFNSMDALNNARSTGVIKPGTTYDYTQSNTSAVTTPPTVKPPTTGAIKPIVQSYGKFFTSSAGDRTAYNTATGYDKLSANQKRLADNVFTTAEKNAKKIKEEEEKKRGLITPISLAAVEETPEQTKDRLAREAGEQAKKNALAEQAALAETERLANEAEQSAYDESTANLKKEQETYTAEEEQTAQRVEETRLNQVRGDIMQSLAARGVDISKLAPEQITALSGEQGVKAFTDIYNAKEKAKSNIKAARDKTFAELQRLRSNKNITDKAYNAQIANINALTNSKLLEADNNYKNTVIGLVDKKIETAGTTATTAVNFLQQAGIPLTEQSKFATLLNNSKNAGEFLKSVINSTDPAIKKVFADNAARISQAAQQEYNLKLLQATPTAKTPVEQANEYFKAADALQSTNPAQAEQLRARGAQFLGTASSGPASTASPSGYNPIANNDPFAAYRK